MKYAGMVIDESVYDKDSWYLQYLDSIKRKPIDTSGDGIYWRFIFCGDTRPVKEYIKWRKYGNTKPSFMSFIISRLRNGK